MLKLSVVQTSLPVQNGLKNSKGSHQVGHIRHMISEVIRESDELEDCLKNSGLGKVKGRSGASGVNEVPIVETR